MTYKNDDIEALFNEIDANKSEDVLIEEDSYGLQANFLSEIERLSRQYGFNRKELALEIKTSPSYLTQVFRGDKPLNFLTLAKIKRALNIRFEIKAFLMAEKRTEMPANVDFFPFKEYEILSSDKKNKDIPDQNMQIAYFNNDRFIQSDLGSYNMETTVSSVSN